MGSHWFLELLVVDVTVMGSLGMACLGGWRNGELSPLMSHHCVLISPTMKALKLAQKL